MLAECINLACGYDQLALLKNLTLTFNEGEFVALVGPNGSGKTTLLKTIAGLLKPIDGQVRLKPHLKFGYVPQQAVLNTALPITIKEFLYLKSHSLEDILQSLNFVGFNSELALDTPLSDLSIGQRQRVVLAYTLLESPDWVCLDEATDGLDSQSQQTLYDTLHKLKKERNTSILIVSHDISAVSEHADRVICLNRALLFDGSPADEQFHSCLHDIYGSKSVIHHHHHHSHGEDK